MGTVWRVRDVDLDLPVALKVVKPDLAADPRFTKLFHLEIRISARFTHPNIVPLHDVGETPDGAPYLGLALADAGSFANLRAGNFSWEELLRLTLELLDALAHLHARGVLHRDLKPENVLLHTGDDGLPHVWLADLGLANASSSLHKKKGRVEGTPGFWAPEQQMGMPREYGPWTDLFSLGVVLWDLVTDRLPFQPNEKPYERTLPPLVPRPGLKVPKGFEAILSNLLSLDPLARYDLAADLRSELEALGEATIVERTREADERPPTGTVTPNSLPSPSSTASFTASRAGTDTRLKWATPTGLSLDLPIPSWNRPKTPEFPAVPPKQWGFGATARGSLALFALRDVPLVARDGVVEEVWQHASEVVRTGRARVVLLVGEAGCGKSRLVDHIVHALEEGGWSEPVRMEYRQPATPDDGFVGAARALIKPWRETRDTLEARLVRRLARSTGFVDDAVHEEAEMLARWGGLGEEDEDPVPDGYGLREIHRTLDAAGWRGLATVVLEDAHWALTEGDGLGLAETLVHDDPDKPWLCLVTLREEALAQDPALAARVAALVEAGAYRTDLARLDRAGTETLVNECLSLEPGLIAKVVDRCEGNPLFARQLLMDWAERSWLVDKGGLRFGLAPGVDVDAVLPQDAEDLFRERVAALAAASGHADAFEDMVHAAALAGFLLPRDVLTGLAPPEVREFALSCGLWLPLEGDQFRFDHQMLHGAMRSMAQRRSDQKQLHLNVSHVYQSLQDAGGDKHVMVGRHAHLGGRSDLAVPALTRACSRAWRLGRIAELQETSKMLVEASENAKLSIAAAFLWRGRSHRLRGESREAGAAFSYARERFVDVRDADGGAAAAIGMGWANRQSGRLADAERLYKEAMSSAKAAGAIKIELEALEGLAWVEQQKRNYEGAELLFMQGANRSVRAGHLRGMASALQGQAYVTMMVGKFDDAAEIYEEAAEAWEEAEDPVGVAAAKVGLGRVRKEQLRFDDAFGVLKDALQVAEELGATEVLMEARRELAGVHLGRRELDKARQLYTTYALWAERRGVFEARVVASLQLALVALFDQNVNGMYDMANRAAEPLQTVPGHWLWAHYRLVVATILAWRRDGDGTYAWLWNAADLGLGDVVSHDTVTFLRAICDCAERFGWPKVMRVCGRLLIDQWQRLGYPDAAAQVGRRVRAVVGEN